MADNHDNAARRIAKRLGGVYDPKSSPDVRGTKGRAEVKSTSDEIPQALRQLSGPGPAYIALPKSELNKALEHLKGLKTGLMDHQGNIVKPSTRKRRA